MHEIRLRDSVLLPKNVQNYRNSLSPLQLKGVLALLKNANDQLKFNEALDNPLKQTFFISFDDFEKLTSSSFQNESEKIVVDSKTNKKVFQSKTTEKTLRREFLYKSMKNIIQTSLGIGVNEDLERSVFIQSFGLRDDKISYVFSSYLQIHYNSFVQFLINNEPPILCLEVDA